ncbi:MAG: protein translocase subunit SecF [Specibacter sp.]
MKSFATFGNELYTGERSYPFVAKRKIWFAITGALIVLSVLVPILVGGFNFGIEFKGGSQFTISNVANTSPSVGQSAVSKAVAGADAIVTNLVGNTMQVQTNQLSDKDTVKVADALQAAYGVTTKDVTSTFVGPSWGADVSRQAIIGFIAFVVLATLLMALYFRTWRMSVAAIIGLLVVMIVTAGVYGASKFEVSPSAIIGFLTILSYSLYDTVVVFDKIRENTADITSSTRRTFGEEVNLAINQTLVRSINTMMVAVLPVGSILFIGSLLLGAGTLQDLSLSLFIGIIVSTFSTIFVSAPMYALLREKEPELIKQTKKVQSRRASEAAATVDA